LINISFYCHI